MMPEKEKQLVDERYESNGGLISESEQQALSKKYVAVAGLGGLGGHLTEQLARLGVGALTLRNARSLIADKATL